MINCKINKSNLIGTELKIIHMDGEPQYSGRTGIVEFVDDADQIHGTWGGCALIPGIDEWIVVDSKER